MSEELPTPKPSPSCLVRRAAAGDTRGIELLYRDLVADPMIRVQPEQITHLATSSTSFLLVAIDEVDQTLCATALLTICSDVMYGTQPFGVVENIVVSQSMRGRGVGRLLLEVVEGLAGTHRCTKLMLLSSRARVDAHGFFRRCGFTSDAKLGFVKYRRQFASS